MRFFNLALATLSSCVALSFATPLVSVPGGHDEAVRRTSSSSKVIIYTDDYISNGNNGIPTADQLTGYNVLILSFLLASGPADQVLAWKQLSSSDRASMKSDYNSAGITLMLSAFGSTDQPTTNGIDATSMAATHAAFVKQYGLQGIDVDYEDMTAMNKQNGKAEQWLIDYTKALRAALPAGQYLITHAPVAPWFSTTAYKSGAYVTVHKEAGDDIDWYNLQFYNQGSTEYTSCTSLITKSGGDFPGTSIKEINSLAGVPFSKEVIGKPSAAYQAENGFVDFSTLATCIEQAGDMGWDAGVMFWEYEKDLTSDLVTTLSNALAKIAGNGGGVPVLSSASGSSTKSSASTGTSTATATASASTTKAPSTKTKTSTSAVPTSSSPSNNETQPCGSVAAWSSTTIYTGGTIVGGGSGTYVSYGGVVYENKWWTQGDTPGAGGDADPWTEVKSCSSSKRSSFTEEYSKNITRARRSTHNNKMRRVHVARSNDLS